MVIQIAKAFYLAELHGPNSITKGNPFFILNMIFYQPIKGQADLQALYNSVFRHARLFQANSCAKQVHIFTE